MFLSRSLQEIPIPNDVQFWTNEQPPFLNKLVINHALTRLVDGECGMQWIADHFNGLPTTPNCWACLLACSTGQSIVEPVRIVVA